MRADILDFLVAQGALAPGEEPPRERIYPPVGALALDRLCDMVLSEAHSLRQFAPGGHGAADQWSQGRRCRLAARARTGGNQAQQAA